MRKVSRILPAGVTPRLFSGIVTFLSNILAGRVFNRPSPRGPLFVTWQLTFDCNAFCTFCSTHKLNKKHPESLALDRALLLADQIADSGTWVVGFTGGEVLMSPALFPLVRRLKSRGLVVYIVTNGKLLQQYAQDIIESGLDYVVVSLDSDKAAEHDDNRKVNGLFQAALDGIAEVKRLRTGSRPLIKTSTVLSAKNIDSVSGMLDFMETQGDVATVQPIVWGYKEHPHGKTKEQLHNFVFGDHERIRVEAAIHKAGDRHALFRSSYFRRIPQFWFDPDSLIKAVPCWSPFLRLSINPEGQALHCGTRFGMVGNLAEQDLMAVWNSQEMISQREIVRTGRNRCICWSQDSSFNNLMSVVPLANRLPVLERKAADGNDSEN